jgi:hypothetical protein
MHRGAQRDSGRHERKSISTLRSARQSPDSARLIHTSLERVKSKSTPGHAVLLRIKKRTRGWEPVPRALITDARLQFDTHGFAVGGPWGMGTPTDPRI